MKSIKVLVVVSKVKGYKLSVLMYFIAEYNKERHNINVCKCFQKYLDACMIPLGTSDSTFYLYSTSIPNLSNKMFSINKTVLFWTCVTC